MNQALIISIGNELLSGKTVNTNATFLAKKLTNLGLIVKKVLTIPDEREIVVIELTKALVEKNFRIIIVTGGLGPTWDDSTAKFLAEALNVPLKVQAEAINIVTERYHELYRNGIVDTDEITSAREKMAYLPVGAKAIYNPVGTAPGIFFDYKPSDCWIFCLPGVPKEMQEMFSIIEPQLHNIQKKEHLEYYEENLMVPFTDESLLAPFLDQVRENYDVWIKSLPKTYQERKNISLIISSSSDKNEEAKKNVLKAKEFLKSLIKLN